MIEFPFPTVEGYLAPPDKEDLRDMAAICGGFDGCYVEIGSMHGLSTLCICAGMPNTKRLIAFDVNHATNKIMANLEEAGFSDRVELITGDFTTTLPDRDIAKIAFAFVDHDHRLKTTMLAYNLIWPRLETGGIMAFHDYCHPDFAEPYAFFQSLEHERLIDRGGMLAFVK